MPSLQEIAELHEMNKRSAMSGFADQVAAPLGQGLGTGVGQAIIEEQKRLQEEKKRKEEEARILEQRKVLTNSGKYDEKIVLKSDGSSAYSYETKQPLFTPPEGFIVKEYDSKGNATYMNPNLPPTVQEQKFIAEQKEKLDKKTKEESAVKDSAKSIVDTISEIKSGIKYFGAAGDLPPFPAEYKKKNWLANYNTLKDKLVVDLMLKLKAASPTGSTGFGQLSEKEGLRLENAATQLQKGLSEEDAKKYLNIIEEGARKILESTSVDSGRIEVISPTGEEGTIPADQLDEAIRSGYRRK